MSTLTVSPHEPLTSRGKAVLGAAVAVATSLGLMLSLAPGDWGSAAPLAEVIARYPAVVTALTAVMNLGGDAVLWWLGTVGAAALLISRHRYLAAYVAVTALGALAFGPAAALVSGSLNGPAMNAVVAGGLVLFALLPALPRRLRPVAAAVVLTVVLAVVFGQITVAAGEVSGVVAGGLMGMAWLGATVLAIRRWPADGREFTAVYRFRPGPWLRTSVTLVAAWVLVAAVTAALGAVITAHPPAFDEAVPRWLAAARTPRWTALSDFWSQAGNTHSILAVCLIVAPLAVAVWRRWRPAVFLAAVMFGEVGVFLAVAATVGRPRPSVSHLDGHLPTASFPSGHVAATTCLYGAIAVLAMPSRRRWARSLALALAILMPAMVALSRVYRGEHHPLDVAGGELFGLLWLAAATLIVRPNASPSLKPPPPCPVEPWCAVIANPARVGNLPRRRTEITAALAARGRPAPMWLETTRDDPGRGQTRQAINAGVTTVVALGGDGTVMACADALAGTSVALGVIPMGTGNLLAANLGIPTRLTDAAAAVAAGHRRLLDVGVVDGRCFTVMAGMGFDARMLHDAPAALKARIGWPAYAAAAVRHLCGVPMNVTLRLDDGPPIRRRARAVLVGNVGRLPGGLPLLPDADPEDGILDIAILMPARRRNWLMLAWALGRRRHPLPTIETFHAKQVTILSDRPQPRELDGDLIGPSDRMTAAVRPAALWVCVPALSPTPTPQPPTRPTMRF